MSIYLVFLSLFVVAVSLSVWRGKSLYKKAAAASVVGLVFVAPLVLVFLEVIPGWGFAALNAVGYAIYLGVDSFCERSPFEEDVAS